MPLSLASAVFFTRLGFEANAHHLDAFDTAVQGVVDSWRGSIDALMLFMTDAGGQLPMTYVTIAMLLVLLALRRQREVRHLLTSALGCLLLNTLLKALFQRARPDAELPYLITRPTSLSFPSGHTMGTASVIGSLIVIVRVLRPDPRIWVAAAVIGGVMILGVALSRIYLGAHYPSDVVGGLLAALAWLSAVTGWVYPRLLPHERAALPVGEHET